MERLSVREDVLQCRTSIRPSSWVVAAGSYSHPVAQALVGSAVQHKIACALQGVTEAQLGSSSIAASGSLAGVPAGLMSVRTPCFARPAH